MRTVSRRCGGEAVADPASHSELSELESISRNKARKPSVIQPHKQMNPSSTKSSAMVVSGTHHRSAKKDEHRVDILFGAANHQLYWVCIWGRYACTYYLSIFDICCNIRHCSSFGERYSNLAELTNKHLHTLCKGIQAVLLHPPAEYLIDMYDHCRCITIAAALSMDKNGVYSWPAGLRGPLLCRMGHDALHLAGNACVINKTWLFCDKFGYSFSH
jgi:hypothetical protein